MVEIDEIKEALIVRYWLFFVVCFFAVSINTDIRAENGLFCSLDKNLQQAVTQGQYKEAIEQLQTRIALQPQADLYASLAILYLKDQQEEQALESFAKSLKVAKPVPGKISQVEERLFLELLPAYFNQNQQLEERLTSILKAHPDYLYVQFLQAATHANQRKFEDFFRLFYRSYMAYPNSYMAYKSQGVLASLLFQRVREPEQKQLWRKEALHFFKMACKEMPKDFNLYKMLICTAAEEERKEIVVFAIKTIIDSNVEVSRGDIPFYINEALLVHEVTLAQEFLDKASSWYQYSRIIQEMQRQIDEQR